MKKKKTTKTGSGASQYDETQSRPGLLRDAAIALPTDEEAMIRTQIYVSRAELEFVQREAGRRNVPMAAVIRQFIDDKMEAPDNAWTNNPMLAPSAEDSAWEGHEDGAINHDHYIYGTPKKFVKSNGKWVEAPSLPEDYQDNPGLRPASGKLREKSK
jgi:hypothetical protein